MKLITISSLIVFIISISAGTLPKIHEKDLLDNLKSSSKCIINKIKIPLHSKDATKESSPFFQELVDHVHSKYPSVEMYLGGISVSSIIGYTYSHNCENVESISLYEALPIGEPINIIYKPSKDQQSTEISESIREFIIDFFEQLRTKHIIRYRPGSRGILQDRLLNAILPPVRTFDYYREWNEVESGYMPGSLLQTTLIKISENTKKNGEIIMRPNVLKALKDRQLLFQYNPYWSKETFFDPSIEAQRLQAPLLAARAIFDQLQLPFTSWSTESKMNIKQIFNDIKMKFSIDPKKIIQLQAFQEFSAELLNLLDMNISNARVMDMNKMKNQELLSELIDVVSIIFEFASIKNKNFVDKKARLASGFESKSFIAYAPLKLSDSFNEYSSIIGMLRGHYVQNGIEPNGMDVYRDFNTCKEKTKANCYAIHVKDANISKFEFAAGYPEKYDGLEESDGKILITNARVLHVDQDILYEWLKSSDYASDSLPMTIRDDISALINGKSPKDLSVLSLSGGISNLRKLGILFYSFLIRGNYKDNISNLLKDSEILKAYPFIDSLDIDQIKALSSDQEVLENLENHLESSTSSESMLLKMILFNYKVINHNVQLKVETGGLSQQYCKISYIAPGLDDILNNLSGEYIKAKELGNNIKQRIENFCNSNKSDHVKVKLAKMIMEKVETSIDSSFIKTQPSSDMKGHLFIYGLDKIITKMLPTESEIFRSRDRASSISIGNPTIEIDIDDNLASLLVSPAAAESDWDGFQESNV